MESVDVCLVEMPFSSYAAPVYSLSLMKGCLNKQNIKSRVIYGNMLYSLRVGVDNYVLGLYRVPQQFLLGEAVFAEGAHGAAVDVERYRERILGNDMGPQKFLQGCVIVYDRLKKCASGFIAELGDSILAQHPRIVAMSSLFLQNNACLALAKYLKAKEPGIVTMIGGANSIGETAWGLVKENPCLDYAFSGEADEIFGSFCADILAGRHFSAEELPFGVLRADMDFSGGEIPVRHTADMNSIPYPDYDDYFSSLREYGLEDAVHPALYMEFSRGCWWNMRKPCTFCGLNLGNREYRVKRTERVLAELAYLAERYDCTKFALTDNILSPLHVREVPPALLERGLKLSFFAEVKSNLTREEVHKLREAGFISLQPGIESLQDDLLLLMNKGNRAIKHVELLKNMAEAGIYTTWHLLAGFPGEKPEYYEELADTISLVTHLQAAQQMVHIIFNRGSEYVNNSEKYGLKLEPMRFYEYVYPNPAFCESAVIMYEPTNPEARERMENIRKASSSHAKALDAFMNWYNSDTYRPQRLTYRDNGSSLEVVDMRTCAVKLYCCLRGVERAAALAANEVICREELAKKLTEAFSAEDIERAVKELIRLKLILEIKGELLFLPIREDAASRPRPEDQPYGFYYKIPLLKLPTVEEQETGSEELWK